MSGTTSGAPHAGGGSGNEAAFPAAIITSRWLLIAAVSALLAFGSRQEPQLIPQYATILAMIVSNTVLAWLRTRAPGWRQSLEVIMVTDVLIVAVVIGWVDSSPEIYLGVFSSLVLALALGRVSLVMGLVFLLCVVYTGYLYIEVGAGFWRQVTLLLRIPFLYATGLHFTTIASCLKREKALGESLMLKARQQSERAAHLAGEQDRLRALSQIGRLGLTGADAHPVQVLLEMCHKAQQALGGARCSLVVLGHNGREQSWNGRSKDRSVEVRTMTIDAGSLDAILLNGKLSELHPGESKELMARVNVFFPDSSAFGSILVAPLTSDGTLGGALFLIDSDHTRKFNEGERDFFWTVSLMANAFIQARERLENEVQLRTLITNAPLIMFALGTDGTIRLIEGRGTAALAGAPSDRIGQSIFDLAGNPEAAREAIDLALAGRPVPGELELEGTLFETQFSPLRGVDGEISGVMGVTTAILESPRPVSRPKPASSAARTPPPPRPTPTPARTPAPPPANVEAATTSVPARREPDAPTRSPDSHQGGPAAPQSPLTSRGPITPQGPLEPQIPLADPIPEDS